MAFLPAALSLRFGLGAFGATGDEVFLDSAHLFRWASPMRFRAAALIFRRLPCGPPGAAAVAVGPPGSMARSSAIWASIRSFCCSKPSTAAVMISAVSLWVAIYGPVSSLSGLILPYISRLGYDSRERCLEGPLGRRQCRKASPAHRNRKGSQPPATKATGLRTPPQKNKNTERVCGDPLPTLPVSPQRSRRRGPLGKSQVPGSVALATTGRRVSRSSFCGKERCCRCCCPALLVLSCVLVSGHTRRCRRQSA